MKLIASLFLIFLIKVDLNFASHLPLREGSSCLTAWGSGGYCKIASNCQWIRDANIQEDNWTLCDDSGILVCCEDSPQMATTAKPVPQPDPKPAPKPVTFDYNRIFYTEEQCQELTQEYDRLQSIAGPVEGIANGDNAWPRDFPFAVSITLVGPDGSSVHQCSGSIITKRHILTAAHCYNLGPDEYVQKTVILYGSVRTDERIKKIRLAKPPHYNDTHYVNTGLGYDLALLFLEDDLEMSVDAFPVCLFHGNVALQPESRAEIAGFGRLADGNFPVHLQKAGINIKESSLCNSILQLKTTAISELRDHQMCAGDSKTKTDTCDGDSGGPLMQKFGNLKSLVGITSFGTNFCKETSRPGIYTRVSPFIDWIEERVKQDFKDLGSESVLDVNKRFT